ERIGVSISARCSKRCRLDQIPYPGVVVGAVSYLVLNLLGLIRKRQYDIANIRLFEQLNLIQEKGPVSDRHDRLWCMGRQWAKPGTFSPSENDCLHPVASTPTML